MKNLLKRLAADERGGEIVEYSLVAGLVVLTTILALDLFGGKVLNEWRVLYGGL